MIPSETVDVIAVDIPAMQDTTAAGRATAARLGELAGVAGDAAVSTGGVPMTSVALADLARFWASGLREAEDVVDSIASIPSEVAAAFGWWDRR
jgi:hypothetical protein